MRANEERRGFGFRSGLRPLASNLKPLEAGGKVGS
jgi:hypothetical protein